MLVGLGASEAGLCWAGDHYRQALAQSTRRKLALLVGINQYSAPKGAALSGCLTDVDLQQELLLHRFGFQASDVVVLSDQQATRQNIETAFMAHLVEQARPDDVVVFHYSGYGRRVRIGTLSADGTSPTRLIEQNTLIPVDSLLPTPNQVLQTINDVLEDTLFLLLRSLQTDQITTILDTSYTYPGSTLRGNLWVRAQPGIDTPESQPAAAELAFQANLLKQVDFSQEQVAAQLRSRQMPGLILSAAGLAQFATEAHWHGFSAGLFTYALTQHLWNTTPASTIRVSFSQATTTVQQLAGKDQQPELSGQKSRQPFLSAYNLPPGVGADGAVTAIANNGKSCTLWLAGLPVELLEQYQANSILTLLPLSNPVGQPGPPESSVGSSVHRPATSPAESGVNPQVSVPRLAQLPRLQLSSVSGLAAQGQLLGEGELQVGQHVQEAVRVLPQNINLIVALDTSLERIERVDATSAFSALAKISSVVAGEQPADYLFAKATETPPLPVKQPEDSSPQPTLVSDSSVSQSRYGLFSLGRSPIANTIGEVGEAIKAAVRRLTPKLQALLANKLLGLTVNQSSSCLGVSATLETTAPKQQVLVRHETLRAPWLVSRVAANSLSKVEQEGNLLTIPASSRIQYRLHNYSDCPVYAVLLGLDSGVNPFAFYPTAFEADNPEAKPLLKNEIITPGQTLIVPKVTDAFEWVLHGPTGLSTTYLILSREPLNQTLALLEAVLRQNSDARQIAALPNILEVAQSVLQDLHQASTTTAQAAGIRSEVALNINAWASLRFVYRVV